MKLKFTSAGRSLKLFEKNKDVPKMYDFRKLIVALNDSLPEGCFLRTFPTEQGCQIVIVDSDSSVTLDYDVQNHSISYQGEVIGTDENMQVLSEIIINRLS